jgi:O-antigen/teichoic acid export membrane protein
VLLVGRLAEQGALGMSMLVLASRLDVGTFGTVSLLFVVNTLGVTLGHWGLGQAVLRLPSDEFLSIRLLHRCRFVNLAIAVVGTTAGIVLGGGIGVACATSTWVWALAGEAFLRKAQALHDHAVVPAACAEVSGALVLFLGVVLTPSSSAILGVGLALSLQHLVQLPWLRVRQSRVFRPDVESPWPMDLLATQGLAFSTANVDYLVAGTILGPTALGLYSLAYRVGNIPQAQIANVATRLALVDLGAGEPDKISERYERYTNRLVLMGVAAMIVTIVASPLLVLLGEQWSESIPVLVVVAVAIPWRMVIGTAGALAMTTGATNRLVRWEVTRLALTIACLSAAAFAGFAWFVVATTVTSIWSSAALHLVAARAFGVHPPTWLKPLAALTTLAALGGVMIID